LNLNFTWTFESFEEPKNKYQEFRHFMLFKLDFFQPFNISQESTLDSLMFHIRNESTREEFFKTKEGQCLKEELSTLQGKVDRQSPDTDSARAFE
jgi:hypothetical protein